MSWKIGLDTLLGVAEVLYAEQRETVCAPPALLQRVVSEGLVGKKAARGLYGCSPEEAGRG